MQEFSPGPFTPVAVSHGLRALEGRLQHGHNGRRQLDCLFCIPSTQSADQKPPSFLAKSAFALQGDHTKRCEKMTANPSIQCLPQCLCRVTFAEKTTALHNCLPEQTWKKRHRRRGLLHLSCVHITVFPSRDRSSSWEQKPRGCLELLPLFHLGIKSLQQITLPFLGLS